MLSAFQSGVEYLPALTDNVRTTLPRISRNLSKPFNATTTEATVDYSSSLALSARDQQHHHLYHSVMMANTSPLVPALDWPASEDTYTDNPLISLAVVTSTASSHQNNANSSFPLFATNSTMTMMTTTTTALQNSTDSIITSSSSNSSSTSSSGGSNNSSSLLDEDNEMLRTIEYIGNILSFYYVPIIVGTGSIGNILSVFVFFKTKLRKLSSSFYLAALAVSDTCFLLGLFAQWLNFVDVHIYNREYFCQFFTFFSNLACFCSVWFVVAFTVERFIAVMYPLKRQTMCTVRRAKMVLLGLTLLGCLHCAPFWISSTPVYSPKLEMTICDIKNEYKVSVELNVFMNFLVVCCPSAYIYEHFEGGPGDTMFLWD